MTTTLEIRTVSKSLSPPPSQPRRIACDRCHGQKLKCPRDENGGPCTRCAKAGAVCHVSPPRATGRPAKHPKPGHKRTGSVPNPTSQPLPTESINAIRDVTPSSGTTITPALQSMAPFSSPEQYLNPTMMHHLPLTSDMSKYYQTADVPFDFISVADPTYATALNFDYDPPFIGFDASPQTFATPSFPQDMTMFNTPMTTAQFNPMPPPPTPPLELIRNDSSSSDGSRFGDDLSRRGSAVDFNGVEYTDGHMSQFSFPPGSSSPALKRGYTMTEEPVLSAPPLPHRGASDPETFTKKRRYSNQPTSTPEHEETWNSGLSSSQGLTALLQEADTFTMAMGQQMSTSTGPGFEHNVDIGVLLRIADRFMVLVSQICQPGSPSPRFAARRRSSTLKHVRKPSIERSHTESEASQMESSMVEPGGLDFGVVQLIFDCYTRVHHAFTVALRVISHRSFDTTTATDLSGFPSSSIGSYTLPNSSSLSTLVHLQVVSHSLERLDSTLHRHLSPDSAGSTFEGIFCKQKRSEMHLQSYKKTAFEEADERKDLLMEQVRDIVCKVNGREN